MRVGYLGPKGTFSHQAAEAHVRGQDVDVVPYNTITELILALNNKDIDEAVVPIENSIEGAVNTTLDMLAWDVDLYIKKEIIVPIEQNLMARHKQQRISRIISHPQAIGQCREFLKKHFPHIPVQYTYSTAQAAGQVASSNEDWAAIASKKAAEEYGLQILHASIQDNDSNVTRFIVLGHEFEEHADKSKTSIIFSTDNRPGSLYRILQILNLWDINMTKIESRPAKDSLGRYIFFVDIEGHWQDEDVQDALTMIKKKTSFFKMLGSYPVEQKD